MIVRIRMKVKIQSGASSQAKHGGAYFLAVYGSIEDPLAAPGPYHNLGPPFLGDSAQPVTFVLPLIHLSVKGKDIKMLNGFFITHSVINLYITQGC